MTETVDLIVPLHASTHALITHEARAAGVSCAAYVREAAMTRVAFQLGLRGPDGGWPHEATPQDIARAYRVAQIALERLQEDLDTSIHPPDES